jgi:hypothetical protein
MFQILGWDVICPRLVRELNEILAQDPLVKEKRQHKRRRKLPIGFIRGRKRLLQITEADLYAFLGTVIEMGLQPLASDKDYWRAAPGRMILVIAHAHILK